MYTIILSFSLGLVPDTHGARRKSAKTLIVLPVKCFSILSLTFCLQKRFCGSCFPSPAPPNNPWTSCGMTRRAFRIVDQFWCSYTLKDCPPSPRICETAKYEPAKNKRWVYWVPTCAGSFRSLVECKHLENKFTSSHSVVNILSVSKVHVLWDMNTCICV
jgi:hypothetical protein